MNDTQTQIEIKKVQTGIFESFLNGKKTEYEIINGSLGMSGRDTHNMYGVRNLAKDTVRWFGPLVTCKKAVIHTLEKRAKEVGA